MGKLSLAWPSSALDCYHYHCQTPRDRANLDLALLLQSNKNNKNKDNKNPRLNMVTENSTSGLELNYRVFFNDLVKV